MPKNKSLFYIYLLKNFKLEGKKETIFVSLFILLGFINIF